MTPYLASSLLMLGALVLNALATIEYSSLAVADTAATALRRPLTNRVVLRCFGLALALRIGAIVLVIVAARVWP